MYLQKTLLNSQFWNINWKPILCFTIIKKNQTSQRFPTNDEITRITTSPPFEATLHLNISCFFSLLTVRTKKKSIVTIKPKKKNPSLFPTTTPLPWGPFPDDDKDQVACMSWIMCRPFVPLSQSVLCCLEKHKLQKQAVSVTSFEFPSAFFFVSLNIFFTSDNIQVQQAPPVLQCILFTRLFSLLLFKSCFFSSFCRQD